MLSQTTEYALRAMACLALQPGSLVPTNIVAERTRVPGNYLAKVLQQLAGAGLIAGRRGVGGGYRLSKPAERITLLEIINAVGTLQRIETCPLGISTHGPMLCPLHRALDDAAAALIAKFDGVTLQSLIDDPRTPSKPLCETVPATLTVGGKTRG